MEVSLENPEKVHYTNHVVIVEELPRTNATPSQLSLSTSPSVLITAGWISATMVLSSEKRNVEESVVIMIRTH